jgi:hypothetical protein
VLSKCGVRFQDLTPALALVEGMISQIPVSTYRLIDVWISIALRGKCGPVWQIWYIYRGRRGLTGQRQIDFAVLEDGASLTIGGQLCQLQAMGGIAHLAHRQRRSHERAPARRKASASMIERKDEQAAEQQRDADRSDQQKTSRSAVKAVHGKPSVRTDDVRKHLEIQSRERQNCWLASDIFHQLGPQRIRPPAYNQPSLIKISAANAAKSPFLLQRFC